MKKLTNKDLADLLKNNVNAFNDYREKFPNQKIDFTKLDDSINFKHSSLDDANLSNMNLEGLNFTDSYMGKVQLKESNISNCDFTRCRLNNSDLRGVKAKNTCFKNAEAKHCDFRGSDVESADFICCSVHYSDFRGSNFNSSQKRGSDHSKKIVTGREWSMDHWYDVFHYESTIKIDSVLKIQDWDEEKYETSASEIRELFFPFFILIFFAILATFLFSTLFEENTDIHFRAMKDTLQNYIDNLRSK